MSTELFNACKNGHKEEVSLLFENEVNKTTKDTDGRTPLHIASWHGHKEVVSFLIDQGVDLEAKDSKGWTPLHIAFWQCQKEVVSLLLERGAKMTAADMLVHLHVACEFGNHKAVSLLIDESNITATNVKNGRAALHIACWHGQKEVVSFLLEKGANIEARDSNGWTPLHIAFWQCQKEVVSLLRERGANMVAEDMLVHLHVACEFGNHKAVSLLIDESNITATNVKDGRTPLHIASLKGFPELVSLLLDKGANIDHGEWTALHFACWNGHKEVVSLLLERRANMEITDMNGWTALHFACRHGREEVVSLLLDNGANLEATDHRINPREYGLKVACEEKLDPEIISLLLSQGADPSEPLKNMFTLSQSIIDLLNNKESAFFLACELWGGEIFDIHVSRGAKPRATNKDGHTSLLIAILKENHTLVDHLINKYNFDLPLEVENRNLLLFVKEKKLLKIRSWIWSHIVQDVKYIDLVRQSLLADASVYSLLDRHQRLISSLALPAVLKVMDEVFLWFGRYRLVEERPEHQSGTCFVFKGEDQRLRDESGGKKKVALKLMLHKDQFLREVEMRSEFNFEESHVISVLTQHPSEPFEISSRPEIISLDPSRVVNGVPTKDLAESMFAISLPLADRNLFVALKQERFAGKDWNMVKFIFKDLVEAVGHLHSKGVIHADLKPLNFVRVNGDWRLIDLDACCRIWLDYTGLKSSSAFCPPESIYVDRSVSPAIASVRSQEHKDQTGFPYNLVLAHPSFDVWGLGCILYQLCTDCRMLFQGGQDDNLRADDGADSLFYLAEWSDALKTQKLSVVEDPLARNLISQLLMKDPAHRPPLARILEHPFVTGRQVSRLVGESAEFDVFLSYRVCSDVGHVELLYNELKTKDLTVWWDKKELKDGENFEVGFCNGLVKSRIFVPFLSKQGLSNFSNLNVSSPCDNVLLEHRLALELKDMGLLEKIFPVILGDEVAGSQHKIDWSTIFPVVSDVFVSSVEENSCRHLQNQALGSPLRPNRTVVSVLNEMKNMQVDYSAMMALASQRIVEIIHPPSPQKTESSEIHHIMTILTREIERIPCSERKMDVLSQFSEKIPDIITQIVSDST